MVVPISEDHYRVIWFDDFTGTSNAIDGSKWDILKVSPGPPITDGAEQEIYTANTSNVSRSNSDTLQITPQKDSQGNWTSARLHGRSAHACPPKKRMLLQAELRLGSAPASKQAGIWPAFWALGERSVMIYVNQLYRLINVHTDKSSKLQTGR